MLDCCQKRLDWYGALFVYSTYPHTHKGNQTMKEEEGKSTRFQQETTMVIGAITHAHHSSYAHITSIYIYIIEI